MTISNRVSTLKAYGLGLIFSNPISFDPQPNVIRRASLKCKSKRIKKHILEALFSVLVMISLAGCTTEEKEPEISTPEFYTSMSAGGSSTLAIAKDGTLWAWGNNTFGQLGDGTETIRKSPVPIGDENQWVSIATEFTSFGVKADGTLWAWGPNIYGQVGDGTTTSRIAPVQIGSDTDWMSIAAGYWHTLGLKSNGTLWAWGSNHWGELGDGTFDPKNAPVQIGTEGTWVSIAAGYLYSIGLKSNGTIWAWGDFEHLSDGTTLHSKVPVQVGTETDWAAIERGGGGTSYALKTNGTLWSWGSNFNGELGDGTPGSFRSAPEQVGDDDQWVQVTAGYTFALGLKSDGTIWAWGANDFGQLGDGTNVNKSFPVQIGSDNTWVFIQANGNHALGLKADGSLWSWGDNEFGQVGDNSLLNRNEPIRILMN